MPGPKNKSYKLGLYVPKAFKGNYPELNSAYPNFAFNDSELSIDFDLDKARRELPPIPTEMDTSRVSMTVTDPIKPISPLAQYTISADQSELRPHGYQTTHNPLYNSSSTTLDSESSTITPIPYLSSSTDADESSIEQLSRDMEDISLPPDLTNAMTKNPLFISDSIKSNMADISLLSDLTNTITDNSAFIPDSNGSIKSGEMPNQLTVVATVESDISQKPNLQSLTELFIPEPDYDEDEFTIDFKSEDNDKLDSNRNSASMIYKNYEGEDFGQYLSDEDEQIHNAGFTWRKNIRHNYPRRENSRKVRTEVKRQRSSSQKTAEKLFKSAPKMKGNTVRQNLREFSFADAKISLAKTVNESSNSHYKKNTEVPAEDEQFLRSRNSYEGFLGTRSSQNMEGGNQNWYREDADSQKNLERVFGLDFTGKLTRKFKFSKDSIVGRLTTKLRRKSESSLKIPEN